MIFNKTNFIKKRDKPLTEEYLSILESEEINDDIKMFFNDYDEVNFINGLTLFGFETAIERQKLYEIDIYDNELFIIGMSGGGEGIFVKRNQDNEEVFFLDLGAIGSDKAELLANSFKYWIKTGALIDFEEKKEDTDLLYDEADLYVVSSPIEKNKFIFALKKKIDLDISVGEISNKMKDLPFLIKTGFYPIKYIDDLKEINDKFKCISLKTKEGNNILI